MLFRAQSSVRGHHKSAPHALTELKVPERQNFRATRWRAFGGFLLYSAGLAKTTTLPERLQRAFFGMSILLLTTHLHGAGSSSIHTGESAVKGHASLSFPPRRLCWRLQQLRRCTHRRIVPATRPSHDTGLYVPGWVHHLSVRGHRCKALTPPTRAARAGEGHWR